MIAHVIVGASAWLILLALFVSALPWRAALPAARSTLWDVVRTTTAHNVMVVDVAVPEMRHTRRAADAIVKPAAARGIDEVLIYVRPTRQAPATVRLQWTPAGGLSELRLGD